MLMFNLLGLFWELLFPLPMPKRTPMLKNCCQCGSPARYERYLPERTQDVESKFLPVCAMFPRCAPVKYEPLCPVARPQIHKKSEDALK